MTSSKFFFSDPSAAFVWRQVVGDRDQAIAIREIAMKAWRQDHILSTARWYMVESYCTRVMAQCDTLLRRKISLLQPSDVTIQLVDV